MMEVHGFVSADDGFMQWIDITLDGVLLRVPDDMGNEQRQLIAQWEMEGNTIPAYEEQELEAPPLTPSIYAVAALVITPGDIGGIDTSVNFAAALYIDVGTYLLFFCEAQENTNYLAKAYDDQTRVRVSEKGLDYIIVTATDGDGNPVDPLTGISVEIIRVS